MCCLIEFEDYVFAHAWIERLKCCYTVTLKRTQGFILILYIKQSLVSLESMHEHTYNPEIHSGNTWIILP